MKTKTFKILAIGLTLGLYCGQIFAEQIRPKNATQTYLTTLDAKKEKEENNRALASGNATEDVNHYNELDRKLGVDLGMFVPLGDFQKSFGSAPAIGLHFTWQAIPPLSFCVSTLRASASDKTGADKGKLTVNDIAIGATANFPVGRFIPFVKMEGTFNFNDVSFSTRSVGAGNDNFITTIGVNVGVGWDFIVGREISFGLDATYHYSVPKKVSLSDGTLYDLGSQYATAAFRVNF